MKTFRVVNFGCRSSQAEGASIHEEIVEGNGVPCDDETLADVVIINSCTVTDEADRQVRQTIRRVARKNVGSRIIVTGCYAQRDPAALADLPNVRFVVGNSHKSIVGSMALQLLNNGDAADAGRSEVFCSDIFTAKELRPSPHFGSGGRTRAVVRVQDGCNANCSFCVIPSVRGRSRSLPVVEVVREVGDLVGRGFKEMVLSGIHMGSFGRDLSPRTSLLELVKCILSINGLESLRLSSIEPLEVTAELIDVAAGNRRFADHFHVPLQSGSARVLRAMRRPYSPAYYLDLVHRIHSALPAAAIGADVMVGFPGETDGEFLETCRLVEMAPLTYLHVFPYSPRPGTAAVEMGGQVPAHVVRHRAQVLRDTIATRNRKFREGLLGARLRVLVLDDEPTDGMRSAISTNFVRVRVPAASPVNRWIEVRVDRLQGDGVQASMMTTAQETVPSCVSEV